MTRQLVGAVLVLVLACPAFAHDDLRSLSQAQSPSSQEQSRQTERRHNELYWGGITLAGAGGLLIAWGLGTEDKELAATCRSFGLFSRVSCSETGLNKGSLIGIGAGLAAVGLVLSVIGGRKVPVNVAASPSRISVSRTIDF